MIPISDKGFTFMLNHNLYWSAAFQALTKSAQNLMWCMYAELRFSGSRKKKNFAYTNNGNISFSEAEFKKQGLGASQTYLNARNLLIEVGFISMKVYLKVYNKYKLLWIEGVPHTQMKWKRYPSENWSNDVPYKKDNMVGKATRFKSRGKNNQYQRIDPCS